MFNSRSNLSRSAFSTRSSKGDKDSDDETQYTDDEKGWESKLFLIKEDRNRTFIHSWDLITCFDAGILHNEKIVDIEMHQCPLKNKQEAHIARRLLTFLPGISELK